MAHADSDLARLDAVALAGLIRSGALSPVEAVQATIDRIEAMDGQLNAVIHRRFEQALDEAAGDLPDGPFRGVPMVLKDLWPTSKGDPFHMGIKAFKEADHRADRDSVITTRYRDAGFVIVGRTNTPELGLTATTEPLSHGPCRNPWNTDHGTGGSSGGAAAAVASGMLPAANASDGGGSIRIPAAMCGLVGLKPSRGRMSMGPYQDEWGLSVQHVVSHSVRDSAAIMDVTCEPTLGDGVVAPRIGQPYDAQVGAEVGRLRIGLWNESPRDELILDPECKRSVDETAALLESLGHDVSIAHPPMADDRAIAGQFTAVWLGGAAANLKKLGEMLGRELGPDDVEPATWAMAQGGLSQSAVDIIEAQNAMHVYRRGMAEWWEDGWDLLLTPTTMRPPPKIGELASDPDDPLRTGQRSIPYAAFTSMFNVTGQPAISLPIHRTADNLPIGVQLVGAYGREDLLIRVAAQLETAVDWAKDRAPIHA